MTSGKTKHKTHKIPFKSHKQRRLIHDRRTTKWKLVEYNPIIITPNTHEPDRIPQPIPLAGGGSTIGWMLLIALSKGSTWLRPEAYPHRHQEQPAQTPGGPDSGYLHPRYIQPKLSRLCSTQLRPFSPEARTMDTLQTYTIAWFTSQ